MQLRASETDSIASIQIELFDANASRNAMRGEQPTLEDLQKVLEAIAEGPRIPPNFGEWIGDTLS
jgi:hypothetical protein